MPATVARLGVCGKGWAARYSRLFGKKSGVPNDIGTGGMMTWCHAAGSYACGDGAG